MISRQPNTNPEKHIGTAPCIVLQVTSTLAGEPDRQSPKLDPLALNLAIRLREKPGSNAALFAASAQVESAVEFGIHPCSTNPAARSPCARDGG